LGCSAPVVSAPRRFFLILLRRLAAENRSYEAATEIVGMRANRARCSAALGSLIGKDGQASRKMHVCGTVRKKGTPKTRSTAPDWPIRSVGGQPIRSRGVRYNGVGHFIGWALPLLTDTIGLKEDCLANARLFQTAVLFLCDCSVAGWWIWRKRECCATLLLDALLRFLLAETRSTSGLPPNDSHLGFPCVLLFAGGIHPVDG